jgi:hypothetical protein
MKSLVLICSLLALPSGVVFAADSPWVGTWKLDEARSHLTGDTFTYSKGPGAMLHYSDGANVSYDFGLDGKEYPSAYGRVTSWTAAGKNAWDSVVKADGKVLGKGHRELSADGKTLTMTFTGTNADGSAYDEQDVYERTGAGEGLIGTWRSVKVKNPSGPRTFVISSPRPGILHYEIPEMKASVEGPADGKDLPISGPDLPPKMTYAYQFLAPTKVSYTLRIDGRVDSQGLQTMAGDGHTYTDVSWSPGKEAEKQTAVWVKQ